MRKMFEKKISCFTKLFLTKKEWIDDAYLLDKRGECSLDMTARSWVCNLLESFWRKKSYYKKYWRTLLGRCTCVNHSLRKAKDKKRERWKCTGIQKECLKNVQIKENGKSETVFFVFLQVEELIREFNW